ncbi:hypothetical protein ACFVT2_36630 [Streptomyces sp. NPDC058000]|uniref:hypothetical protein n=1 Tax=Streptomyces sp. NPDC058000 TaxID=3346299 RepID=UPI0036ED0B50
MLFEALSLGSLGRAHEAEAIWHELIALSTTTGDDLLLGQAHSQYAAFLTRNGRSADAAPHLDAAIDIYHRRNDGRAVAALTGHLTTLGPSGQTITDTGQ